LSVALENAQKFGVADRFSVRAGSAFEVEMGSGYDYVLLTNIFHHFDMPTCEKLMRRVHTALKPGGKVCAQRGSRDAADRGSFQPDHAGEYGCGRRVHVFGV